MPLASHTCMVSGTAGVNKLNLFISFEPWTIGRVLPRGGSKMTGAYCCVTLARDVWITHV